MTFWLFVAQLATLVLLLGLTYRPLGDYMAATFTTRKDLKVERGFYRLIGVDSRADQSWPVYLRSVLAFSVLGVLLVYLLQRIQAVLPYSLGLPAVPEGLSFNTAISFVTNTNWQSYSPEVTMGYTVQIAGLAVQNFLSAAVGLAVAITLVRGFAAHRSGTVGNLWVDVTRATLRYPLCMGLDNPVHILLLLLVVLLVFGAKRLPEIGRSLGEGMRGFKDSLSGQPSQQTSLTATPVQAPPAPAPAPVPVAVTPEAVVVQAQDAGATPTS